MTKAVVMDVKDGYAAVLKDDGTFARIKRKCERGDIIYLSDEKKIISFGRLQYIAAAMALVLFISGGFYMTVPACTYVSFDVNPSLEFALNRMDRVVGVTPLNEDAQVIKDSMDVRFKTLDEALSITEQALLDKGFVSDEQQNYYLLNISTKNEGRRGRLEKKARDFMGHREGAHFHVVITSSPREEREKAAHLGISTGRFEEIKKIEPDEGRYGDAVRDFGTKPVRDLFIEAGEIKPEEEYETDHESVTGDEEKGGREGKSKDDGDYGTGSERDGGDSGAGSERSGSGYGAGSGKDGVESSGAEDGNTRGKPQDDRGNDSREMPGNKQGNGSQEMPENKQGNGSQEMPQDKQGNGGTQMPENKQGSGSQEMPQDNQDEGGTETPGGMQGEGRMEMPRDMEGGNRQEMPRDMEGGNR